MGVVNFTIIYGCCLAAHLTTISDTPSQSNLSSTGLLPMCATGGTMGSCATVHPADIQFILQTYLVSLIIHLLILDFIILGVQLYQRGPTFGCEFLLDLLSCFRPQPQCFTQGMVDKGSYLYTDHLISLNSFSSSSRYHLVSLLSACLPLIVSQWHQDLSDHPDRRSIF